jgi:hypothetical protein
MVASQESLAALIRKVTRAVDVLAIEDPLRGPEDAHIPGGPPNVPRYGAVLGVEVADYYAESESVLITGVARNWAPGRPLWARLDSKDKPQPVTPGADGAFAVDFGPVEKGLHTLTLTDDPEGAALFLDVLEAA